MKRFLILGVACIALAGCATGNGGNSNLPSPSSLEAGLALAVGGYTADCAAQPTVSWCSKAAQKEAQACVDAANAGLATYTEAYNSGNVSQALLDNEETLVPALVACIANVKKG